MMAGVGMTEIEEGLLMLLSDDGGCARYASEEDSDEDFSEEELCSEES